MWIFLLFQQRPVSLCPFSELCYRGSESVVVLDKVILGVIALFFKPSFHSFSQPC